MKVRGPSAFELRHGFTPQQADEQGLEYVFGVIAVAGHSIRGPIDHVVVIHEYLFEFLAGRRPWGSFDFDWCCHSSFSTLMTAVSEDY